MESFELLQQMGFDEEVAKELAQKRGLTEIKQQIDWLPHRNPERNSLGMLRKSIEADWSKPDSVIKSEKKRQRIEKEQKKATQEGIDDALVVQAKREKKRRRERLLPLWEKLSIGERSQIEKQAFAELNSNFLRERFKKNEEFRMTHCLDFFAERQQAMIAQTTNKSQENKPDRLRL